MEAIGGLALVAGGFFLISIVIAAAVLLSCLALGVLGYGVRGAACLLELAAVQGFIGLVAYGACWFFLFPVMLIASVVIGVIESRVGEPSPPRARSQNEIVSQRREEDQRYELRRQMLVLKARLREER